MQHKACTMENPKPKQKIYDRPYPGAFISIFYTLEVITMKNMKLKAILLICCLLLTAVLGGCGKAASSTEPPAAQETPAAEPAQEAAQTESEAAAPEETVQEKALKAYQEILKAAPDLEGEHEELYDASFGSEENQELFGNHYDMFMLADINQDEIPELIALSIVNFRWTQMFVYTYADGEAVLLRDQAYPDALCSFDQMSTANGSCFAYICGEHHIHNVWRGANPMGEAEEENHAYAIAGTALTELDCPVGEDGNTIYFYDAAIGNTAENVDAMVQ